MTQKILYLLLITICMVNCFGADFYVATDGSDSNPGTEQEPFRTITKARHAMRKVISGGLDSDKTVYIRQGVYNISEPIEFTLADSGTADHSITFRAYPDEKVVIDGAKKIPNWRLDKERNCLYAVIPEIKSGKWNFRQLYKNGESVPLTRLPEKGYFRKQKAVNNTNAIQFYNDDLNTEYDYSQAELLFIHDWSISRSPIKSVDFESRIITTKYDAAFDKWWFKLGRFPHQPYAVENILNFSQPGHWSIDYDKGIIRYFLLPKDQGKKHEFYAPFAEHFIIVNGQPEKDLYVQNLHFKDIEFQFSNWVPENNHFLEAQANFYVSKKIDQIPVKNKKTSNAQVWKRIPASIEFNATKNCSLERVKLSNISQAGVSFERQCYNNTVNSCHFVDIAGNGIMIGEIENNRLIDGKVWWKKSPKQASADNKITNNLIEKCGQVYFGAVGVWMGLSSNNLVAHNLIRDLPYSGVSSGWLWSTKKSPCKGNIVQYNHVYNVLKLLNDGGAFYFLGRQDGALCRGNLIHNISECEFSPHPLNNAFRWDRGGAGVLVEYNLVYNIQNPLMQFNRESRNNWVQNNIFVKRPDQKTVNYSANKTQEEKDALIKMAKDNNRISQSDPQNTEFKQYLNYYTIKTGPEVDALAWLGLLEMENF